MKRIILSVCIALLAMVNPSYALDGREAGSGVSVDAFLNSLKAENYAFYSRRKIEFFSDLANGQFPLATIVSCSDSRVQINMLSTTPEGRLFVIDNLGNQIATAEGSVEYGVHHLHTPVLLILGHSRCGAIAAVTGNYSKESAAIRRELDTITISKDLNNMAGVKANVHNQVVSAMLKFDEEVKEGRLTIIGAVLDFADDLHQGAGKLHIINVNGETDANKLANLESLLTKSNTQLTLKRKGRFGAKFPAKTVKETSETKPPTQKTDGVTVEESDKK